MGHGVGLHAGTDRRYPRVEAMATAENIRFRSERSQMGIHRARVLVSVRCHDQLGNRRDDVLLVHGVQSGDPSAGSAQHHGARVQQRAGASRSVCHEHTVSFVELLVVLVDRDALRDLHRDLLRGRRSRQARSSLHLQNARLEATDANVARLRRWLHVYHGDPLRLVYVSGYKKSYLQQDYAEV